MNLDEEDVVLSNTISKPVIVCCSRSILRAAYQFLFSSAVPLRKGNHAPP